MVFSPPAGGPGDTGPTRTPAKPSPRRSSARGWGTAAIVAVLATLVKVKDANPGLTKESATLSLIANGLVLANVVDLVSVRAPGPKAGCVMVTPGLQSNGRLSKPTHCDAVPAFTCVKPVRMLVSVLAGPPRREKPTPRS